MFTTLVATFIFAALITICTVPVASVYDPKGNVVETLKTRWIYIVFAVPLAAVVNAVALYFVYYSVVRVLHYRLEAAVCVMAKHWRNPTTNALLDASSFAASGARDSPALLVAGQQRGGSTPPASTTIPGGAASFASASSTVAGNNATITVPDQASPMFPRWLRNARRIHLSRHWQAHHLDESLNGCCIAPDMKPVVASLVKFVERCERLEDRYTARFEEQQAQLNSSFHSEPGGGGSATAGTPALRRAMSIDRVYGSPTIAVRSASRHRSGSPMTPGSALRPSGGRRGSASLLDPVAAANAAKAQDDPFPSHNSSVPILVPAPVRHVRILSQPVSEPPDVSETRENSQSTFLRYTSSEVSDPAVGTVEPPIVLVSTGAAAPGASDRNGPLSA